MGLSNEDMCRCTMWTKLRRPQLGFLTNIRLTGGSMFPSTKLRRNAERKPREHRLSFLSERILCIPNVRIPTGVRQARTSYRESYGNHTQRIRRCEVSSLLHSACSHLESFSRLFLTPVSGILLASCLPLFPPFLPSYKPTLPLLLSFL